MSLLACPATYGRFRCRGEVGHREHWTTYALVGAPGIGLATWTDEEPPALCHREEAWLHGPATLESDRA